MRRSEVSATCSLAVFRARASCRAAAVASIASTDTTTSNSMRVNPARVDDFSALSLVMDVGFRYHDFPRIAMGIFGIMQLMAEPSLLRCARTAASAAREAGTLIARFAGRPSSVTTKRSANDLVTEIDRASERLIHRRLHRAFPPFGFAGGGAGP